MTLDGNTDSAAFPKVVGWEPYEFLISVLKAVVDLCSGQLNKCGKCSGESWLPGQLKRLVEVALCGHSAFLVGPHPPRQKKNSGTKRKTMKSKKADKKITKE